MPIDTKYMNERADKLSRMEKVIEFCRENDGELVSVSRTLTAMCEEKKLDISGFIAKCGFSRSNKKNIEGWFSGASEPRSRKEYLKIAIGLGLTLPETNRFLVRVGGYGALYPKNTRDAACICMILNRLPISEFDGIERKLNERIELYVKEAAKPLLPEDYEESRVELLRALQEAEEQDLPEEEKKKIKKKLTTKLNKLEAMPRLRLREKLSASPETLCPTETMLEELVSAPGDMDKYIDKYWREYVASGYRLLAYIDALIENYSYENEDGRTVDSIGAVTSSVAEDLITTEAKTKIDTEISYLRTEGRIPSRETLIALGVLLDEDVDGINNLLDIAGMEPMCARRGVEAALRAALQKMRRSGYVSSNDACREVAEFSALYKGKDISELMEMLIYSSNE